MVNAEKKRPEPPTPEQRALGARLRQARLRAEKTNASAFARDVGVTPTTVYRIERGLVQPSIETLAAWARAASTTTDYLLGLTDNPAAEAA